MPLVLFKIQIVLVEIFLVPFKRHSIADPPQHSRRAVFTDNSIAIYYHYLLLGGILEARIVSRGGVDTQWMQLILLK